MNDIHPRSKITLISQLVQLFLQVLNAAGDSATKKFLSLLSFSIPSTRFHHSGRYLSHRVQGCNAVLFGHLWSRFYSSDAPLDLYTDLEDYMSGSCDFTHIDIYKVALLSRAEKEVCSQIDSSRKIVLRVLQLIQLIFEQDW